MKVLVTGATRNTGLGIIRALAAAGHQVIGADDRSLPFGLHSRHCGAYLPHANRHSGELAPSLLEIIKTHRPDVFVPVGAEGDISKHRGDFEQLTRLLVPPYASYCKAFYKEELLNECVELGIPAPRMVSHQEACSLLAATEPPGAEARLVVKPSADIGGGSGVFYVKDRTGLENALEYVSVRYGRAVINEYVPGRTDAMRALHLLFDGGGKLAAWCIHRKLMQYPPNGGVTALAVSTHEFHLVEAILPFFSKWRWQGPVDAEVKIDSETGEPKLIEINPRYSGITSFSIACGVDLPVLACELAVGMLSIQRPRVSYPADVKCINPGVLAKSLWMQWRSSPDKWRFLIDAMRSLKGAKIADAHSLRDVRPSIGKWLLEMKDWLRARWSRRQRCSFGRDKR